jgi:hypothetical protein
VAHELTVWTPAPSNRPDVLTIGLGPKVPKRGRLRRPLQRRPLVQKNVQPEQRIGELPDRLQAVLSTETLQRTPVVEDAQLKFGMGESPLPLYRVCTPKQSARTILLFGFCSYISPSVQTSPYRMEMFGTKQKFSNIPARPLVLGPERNHKPTTLTIIGGTVRQPNYSSKQKTPKATTRFCTDVTLGGPTK